jgi:hypothetical protein
VPKNGDEIAGPVGTFTQRGPAYDPTTSATITGASAVTQVIKPQGTVQISWVRITSANFDGTHGTGSGIAMGSASPQSVTYAVEVVDTDGAGITNANGVFDRIELARNTLDPNALGFIGSGIKGGKEYVIKNSYVHDQQGNGIWCDEYCHDTNVADGNVSGKFYAHDNLIVSSAKQSIRWEKVGSVSTAGEALIEKNTVHGNNKTNTGGIGVRDAQNAVIRYNTLGAAPIAGISYPSNGYKVAVRATDSGRSDRPDTMNITVQNNTLNGEVVKCLSGTNLTCSPNTQ